MTVMMFIAAEIRMHHHLHSSTFFHPKRIYKTVRIKWTTIPTNQMMSGVKFVSPVTVVVLMTEKRYQVIDVITNEITNWITK